VVCWGSVGLNHSKLTSSSTTFLVPCPVLWFKQVRGGLVGLNHPELMTNNYPMIVISSGTHWFEEVQKRWTTPNSWEITLWSVFPLELSGSIGGSLRFSRVEPLQTHVKLHHISGSSSCAMVRTGSKEVKQQIQESDTKAPYSTELLA